GHVPVAEPEDGAVTADEAIGEPGADDRHRERRGDEVVVDALGAVALPAQELLHVRHEDRGHAVEAEPLARLVAEDVLDRGRETARAHARRRVTSHIASPGSAA